jgi:Protein of unknown function (DUF2599)
LKFKESRAERMRAVLAAALTAPVAVLLAVPLAGHAFADPVDTSYPPPFVDHTQWAHWGDMSSLRVYPTPAGRAEAGGVDNAKTVAGDEAWSEVVAAAPEADTPGMRDQFLCHWQFAEFAQPGKASWNLEPWRPVVDAAAMVGARCNPGGSEEPF